jgi:hypothetical protein
LIEQLDGYDSFMAPVEGRVLRPTNNEQLALAFQTLAFNAALERPSRTKGDKLPI